MLQNLIKVFIAVLVISTAFFFISKKCNQTTTSVAQEATGEPTVGETTLPDDFYAFYDQFHVDSTYQWDHISFPLTGIGMKRDTSNTVIQKTWTAAQWDRHGPFNSQDGLFTRTFTNINGLITEVQSARGGMFTLEKRYAKLAGKWHLIYYQELLMQG